MERRYQSNLDGCRKFRNFLQDSRSTANRLAREFRSSCTLSWLCRLDFNRSGFTQSRWHLQQSESSSSNIFSTANSIVDSAGTSPRSKRWQKYTFTTPMHERTGCKRDSVTLLYTNLCSLRCCTKRFSISSLRCQFYLSPRLALSEARTHSCESILQLQWTNRTRSSEPRRKVYRTEHDRRSHFRYDGSPRSHRRPNGVPPRTRRRCSNRDYRHDRFDPWLPWTTSTR